VLSKPSQYANVLLVAAAPLNQANSALILKFLNVIDGRLVKLNQFSQVKNPLVNI
jgi:hypothetical protein